MNGHSSERVPDIVATALPKMKEIIADAAQSIEKESSETKQPWMNCFVTVVTGIEGYFGIFKEESPVYSPTEYAAVERKISLLLARLEEIRPVYPREMPPQEVRDELMAMLDVFRKVD